MKKLLLFITMSLILMTICPVFASDVTTITNTSNTGDIEVIYTVDDSYLITIPDEFNLLKDGEVPVEISATDVCIGYGTELHVTITGANCSGDSWYIVDEEEGNEENKFEYTIGTESGLADISSGNPVIIVEAGNTDGESQELFFNLKDAVTKSGTYSDTLTFKAEIIE